MKYFLESKCAISCINKKLQTPILVATYGGNINLGAYNIESLGLVKLCIQFGAKLNDRDIKGMTPVHYAASAGNMDILALLYHQGASLDVRDLKGRTPLMVASQGNHVTVCVFENQLTVGYSVVIAKSLSLIRSG